MSDFSKLKVKKNGKECVLNACTQDTEQNITGTKNFTKLTVNSKNVVTSINGAEADTSGNVTIPTSFSVDYSASVNFTSPYTVQKNGIIICSGSGNSTSNYFSIMVNGVTVISFDTVGGGLCVSHIVSVGDVITTKGAINPTMKFYPFK